VRQLREALRARAAMPPASAEVNAALQVLLFPQMRYFVRAANCNFNTDLASGMMPWRCSWERCARSMPIRDYI